MSRGKVFTLVGLAVAVLVFDAWFFLGNGEAAAPIEAGTEPGSPRGGEFHLADLLPGAEPAPTPRPAAVPWHDPATWPLPERRPPRRGHPRPGLMVRPPAPAGEDGARASLPRRVPVILWRPGGALALVGNRLVREGDRVGPWLVREIRPDRVRLVRADGGGKPLVLPLGGPPRPQPAAASRAGAAAPAPAPSPDPAPPAAPAPEEVP